MTLPEQMVVDFMAHDEKTCYGLELMDEQVESHMALEATWATQAELMGAAALLKTNIVLWTTEGPTWKWATYPANRFDDQMQVSEQSIYLRHTNNNHFDYIKSINFCDK